jgi:predicted TIM-barrel fold metal-dependent hydrolase
MGAAGAFPLHPEMVDLDQQIEAMESAGVDQAVLSIIPPAADGFEVEAAKAIAAASNDAMAEIAQSNPGRFAALAILPTKDPDAAAEELRRAVGIGLRGGVLLTHVEGVRLDHERFRPIFESAAELDVPIVLHPTTPVHPDPYVDYALMTTVGFVVETTLCVLRLVFGGLYERHPDFKMLAPHVGAAVPYLLGRIDYEASRYPGAAGVVTGPPSEHLRRVFLDSVSAWPPAVQLVVDVFGADHVLFATDAPFWDRVRNVDAVEATRLEGEDLQRVLSGNADRLFALTS